jgi:RNA polymerase sigma-70 factor (ECF subfamily)
VWENRETLDTELSFSAYLHRIAKNRIIDIYRKSNRDKILEARLTASRSVAYSHVEETVIEKEERELILYAIEQLPTKRKLIYKLCKIEGKSYQEVSELLGISVHTVNDHIKKANSFLKELLSNPKELLAAVVPALLMMNL